MNDAGRIGFLIRGDYSNTATYDFLDVVYYGNSSYVAKKLTTGHEPMENSEYWHILASTPQNAVTGVKGNAESTFRTGNINLTPANIGALASNGTAVSANKLTANAGSSAIPIYFSSGVPAACEGSTVRKKVLFQGEITISNDYTDGIYGVSNCADYDLVDITAKGFHIFVDFSKKVSFYPVWAITGLSTLTLNTMLADVVINKSGTGYVEFSLPRKHVISSSGIVTSNTEVTIDSAVGYKFH